MALMMYMSEGRIASGRRCTDTHINRMLLELRACTGEDWIVDEYRMRRARWFHDEETSIEYRLCRNTGHGEVQVHASMDNDIELMTNDIKLKSLISKEVVTNYINGYLMALNKMEGKER